MIMLAGTSPVSFGIYNSIANKIKVPLIDWETSDKRESESSLSVSVRPLIDELLVDYIILKNWQHIIYFHDGTNAERSFSSIYAYLKTKTPKQSIYIDAYRIPEDEEYFRDFLNAFHRKKSTEIEQRGSFNVVVDIVSSYRVHAFLKALEESIFISKYYNYVFANFDLDEKEIESLQYMLINITAFRLFDRFNKQYQEERKAYEHVYGDRTNLKELPMNAMFAHDAVLVAGHAIDSLLKKHGKNLFANSFSHHQMYNKGYPGIHCPSVANSGHQLPFEPFEYGEMIYEALKGVSIDVIGGTLSGRIQFDEESNSRVNFTATVIEIKQKQSSFDIIKETFEWTQGKGFSYENNAEAPKVEKYHETKLPRSKSFLRIVTVLVKPFVMLKRIRPGEPTPRNNDRFEGFCVDLMELLSKNLSDFQYDIFISDGNKYGARQDDGSWDGMIGYLLNETADVAVAPLTINQERERVVDFSKPFMTTGISIMVKKPEKQEFSVFSFMQPLSMKIWIFILCSYIGVSTTIFFVSSFSPYERRAEENPASGLSLYNTLWFTLAAFMQQGTDILPRAPSGRIASSVWWFFTLIMVSSYTANLAAFLTLEKMTPPIESVDDLAAQQKILYGIVKGGSTEAFFEDSAVPIYKKMWNFMHNTHLRKLKEQKHLNTTDTIMVNTYAEGIDKVRRSKGLYAFLLEETANEYENTRKPCDTMKVGTNLNTLGYGVATKIGNPLRESLNLVILYLHEKGELKRLENKWWYDRGQCDQSITDSGSSSSLALSKVAGIFYILCCGMVLSMLTALIEYIYRLRRENREKSTTTNITKMPVAVKTSNGRKRTHSESTVLRHLQGLD